MDGFGLECRLLQKKAFGICLSMQENHMTLFVSARLGMLALCVMLLGGCAGVDVIKGKLNYDLRPEGERSAVFWPPAPDTPRYRYVGELVGQPNFVGAKTDDVKSSAITILKWIVGLFDSSNDVLLMRPQHGAVAEDGRVYVVDAGRNALVVFDPNALAEDGQASGEGQMLIWEFIEGNTRFASPISVAMVWDGTIAVTDAKLGMVMRLDRSGKLISKMGVGQLQRPTGIAFDRDSGQLFVADSAAHDIKVFDRAGQLVRTIGGPGEGAAQFNAPTQLAFGRGHLYVSDTLNSRVQVFDTEGQRVSGFGERGLYVGNLTRPKGVAVDDTGIVYVIESYFAHLLAYSDKGEYLLGINGSGLQGGQFFLPSGVWTDRQGRLFVADMFNGRVVVFEFLGNQGS